MNKMYMNPVTGDVAPLEDWLLEEGYILVYEVTRNCCGEWVDTGDYFEREGEWVDYD